jgi:hypothetical protein
MPTRVSPEYSETVDLPPLGALSDQEIKELNEGYTPNWLFLGWEYYVLQVLNTYTGYIWRNWQDTGEGPGTLVLSNTFGISNGWSSSIGFKDDVLSAAVGYNVTYSSSTTASYSHDVSPGMWGHIGYADFYDNTVHDLSVAATQYVFGGSSAVPIRHSTNLCMDKVCLCL